MLSFFPRDVLDEILNLTESVSEEFPSYSSTLVLNGIFQKEIVGIIITNTTMPVNALKQGTTS